MSLKVYILVPLYVTVCYNNALYGTAWYFLVLYDTVYYNIVGMAFIEALALPLVVSSFSIESDIDSLLVWT